MSLQVHDPVEAVKGIRPVDLHRFEDELTTPKTIIFDEHHAALKDDIKSNLAANGGENSEANIDLDALAEKAKTDNNTRVDKLSVKEIYSKDIVGDDGHKHKEFISTNGTKVEYETSNFETNIKELEKQDESTEMSSNENHKHEVVTEASSAVTSKVIHHHASGFVNNLDVKVREVFPDLSTSTPRIIMHTPANIVTIPVVDAISNTTHPRLRISVKANKSNPQNDSETNENILGKVSNRGQKSYLVSTPSSVQDSKSSNEIQQAQETVHGTTKAFRQLNSFSQENMEKYNMNLPDNADAWSLIGMKHVPTQKQNISAITETPINVKELVDWSEIMKNERNSSENTPNSSTIKNIIGRVTESQGEENKLIPVQVPAPTKSSALVVENNIPSNDLTTMKPEEFIEKNDDHKKSKQDTKDDGDNLQFNRVDDFEINSPSSNIEKINITLKNAVIVNATFPPVIITFNMTTMPPKLSEVTEASITEKQQVYTTTIGHQKVVSKNHKKQMTIGEQKVQMTMEQLNHTTQPIQQTTSNILEMTKTSTSPNIVIMSPDQINAEDKRPSTVLEVDSSTASEYDMSAFTNEIIPTTTDVPTEITEENLTTMISNSPTSSEIMFNDSPSLPTEVPKYETTTVEEASTSMLPEQTTETEESSFTTINTQDVIVTETETTITETPLDFITDTNEIATDVPASNKSSSTLLNFPETTLSSSSGIEETTYGNMIVKIMNVTEKMNEESDFPPLPRLTTFKPKVTPTPDTLSSDDFIDEYSDITEGIDININGNNNNNIAGHDEEIFKNKSSDIPILPTEHEKEIHTTSPRETNPGQTAPPPDMNADKDIPDFITDRVLQEDTTVSTKEPFVPPEIITTTIFSTTSKDPDGSLGSQEPPEEGGAVAAVTISIIGVIALIVLVALLYVMRKRQHKRTYGQRCTPVSLDAYSVDSVSVYSSVRGKNRARASKRSYGNPAFNDSGMTSHSMSFPALSNFISDEAAVFAEFTEIPTVTVRADEVPAGCEVKNRYANVMPLPETRVPLTAKPGDETGAYINANFVRGPRGIRNYYIACQAPMQSTVNDFWRMIWEQQSKVILMLTDLYENGVEKCTDYLPPSEVLDCHRLFGDFKVTLKKREVKDKYVISNVQLCNMESGTWREVTHLWYMWPEKGVPKEYQSMIAFLIEARSFMKSPHEKTENNNTSVAKTQPPKKEGSEVNIYSPQQAQKVYRKAHRAPTEPPNSNGDAKKSPSGESSSKNAQAKTTTTSMCRLTTINEKSPNGSVSEPPSQYSTAPVVVHCSPGTGRTGAVIACDLAIKEFEVNRTIDLPKTVYRIRRDRASSVQTKEQYMFIYQVINLYATKLTGGVLDSI
ncbi:uncharacterized protein LOC113364180 isoform X1 [Ctenocephalides felis]|uniref:uncharacterized protein LOC113364180 isoform X1 n=1 Tax=Ctenocephalides felis TaxID=7515 RepID=UPI000E6E41EE|nr:uncharacterized protein LOC113364180 isoform X1 [Ctenocephalides felis]